MSGDVDVITGSVAFGMGVDKSDVRSEERFPFYAGALSLSLSLSPLDLARVSSPCRAT